jgi:diphthine-ammonia ligase
MKLVGLISGGKDSIFNLMKCVENGHDIKVLANLYPENSDEIDSYMYQSVGHEVIDSIAECIGVPLRRKKISGIPKNVENQYMVSEGDEVEDLFILLNEIKQEFSIEGVAVGAILSNYQRCRVEHVCSRLNLTCFSYLWRYNQLDLLNQIVENNVHAILIKVAAYGLTARDLGRSLAEMIPKLKVLQEKYDVHPAGEGGEYETLVLDCPLYKKKLVLDKTFVVSHSYDVSFLKIAEFSTEDKINIERLNVKCKDNVVEHLFPHDTISPNENINPNIENFLPTPYFLKRGPFIIFNGIFSTFSPNVSDQMCDILKKLEVLLKAECLSFRNVVLTNIYMSDMSEFDKVNKVYRERFSDHPATRTCVALKSLKYVMCDFLISTLSDSRMHVQSRSYWAPANIGPYSQAICIDSSDSSFSRLYISGQIGLIPESMTLPPDFESQYILSCRHFTRIVYAILHNSNNSDFNIFKVKHSTEDLFTESPSGRSIMVSKSVLLKSLCFLVNPLHILISVQRWKALFNDSLIPPTLFVLVKQLPRNALIEWECSVLNEKFHDVNVMRSKNILFNGNTVLSRTEMFVNGKLYSGVQCIESKNLNEEVIKIIFSCLNLEKMLTVKCFFQDSCPLPHNLIDTCRDKMSFIPVTRSTDGYVNDSIISFVYVALN